MNAKKPKQRQHMWSRTGHGLLSLFIITYAPLALISSPAHGAAACERFGEVTLHSQLQSPILTESSGLALSQNAPHMLWTHNDSGDGAFLYAFNLEEGSHGFFRSEEVRGRDQG